MISLTFSLLFSFGCGIMSLLSSFGRGMPCVLSKIMKKIFIVRKNLPIWSIGDDRAPNTVSPATILWLKLSNSNFQSFLKLIKWYTIPSQIHARSQIQKHHSNFTKCPVNKLIVAAFTASFSLRDIIESCVEILLVLYRFAKFKLIKIAHRDSPSHMSPIAHRDRTWHMYPTAF